MAKKSSTKTKKKKSTTKSAKTKKRLQLKAKKRKVLGRKVKKLRKKEILPANVYGKDIKSQALKLSEKDFLEVYQKAGETGIVELKVGSSKKKRPVLIHNLQIDPVTGKPLHADFHQVDLTKKVQVEVPIEYIGESPAVEKGGVLMQLLNEVEVEALPADLPDKFEVDLSQIEEIGQSIAVKDLKVSDKVKILVEDLEELLAKVQEPQEEEEPEPETAVSLEGEEEPEEAEGEEDKKEGKEEKSTEESKKEPASEKKEEKKKS